MKRKAAFVTIALLLTTMVLAPAPASAATSYTWNDGSPGFWQIAGNWSPTGVPNSSNGDSATISGSVVQLQGNSNPSVTNLIINPGAEVETVVTSPTNYDTTFTFAKTGSGANPTLTNNGTFTLADTGKLARIAAANSLTISGSGKIVMESSTHSSLAGPGVIITNQAGHTIQGIGMINDLLGPAYLYNYGLVEALAGTPSDRLLILITFNNYTGGLLRSNPGAYLQLGSSSYWFAYYGLGGWLDLNGGTVNAQGVSFYSASIRNSGAPSGTMESSLPYSSLSFYGPTTLDPGTVINFNNSGMVIGQYNSINAIVTNNGVINLIAPEGGYSNLGGINGHPFTLTGSGRLVLNGNGTWNAASLGGPLTNEANHTIAGEGTIPALVNNGTLLADNHDLTILGNISGTGQVQVHDNGRLVVGKSGWVPSLTLAAKDLLMSSGGAIYVDFGSTVSLAGNFSYAMTDTSKWFWYSDDPSTLRMSGSGAQQQSLEVGGKDYGLSPDGFNNNFNLPKLNLAGSGTYVYLADDIDNGHRASPEALYVNSLSVPTGTTLNLNRLHLYTYLSGEIHQVKRGEGDLFGHGQIIDESVKPVPIAGIINLLLLD